MMDPLREVRSRLTGGRRRRGGPSAVLGVVAGKGGAGVSLVSAALALRSAGRGLKTLLVDADPWIDLQRVWLGGSRGAPLEALRGGGDPEDLVIKVPSGVDLVSFGSGRPSLPDIRALARRVPQIFATRDVILADCGSGLAGLERALDLQVGSLLVVTGADPVGLAATHAFLKAVSNATSAPAFVLFNRVRADEAVLGEAVLAEGGRRFLGGEPHTAGVFPPDDTLGHGLATGAQLTEAFDHSTLSAHVDRVIDRLPPWNRSHHGF